jgi:hypothetical protein
MMRAVLRTDLCAGLILALAAGLFAGRSPAAHAQNGPDPRPVAGERAATTTLELSGYAQLWWTIWEQVENQLRQPHSRDPAADIVSGLSIRRARLAASFEHGALRGRLSLRLEGSPVALSDAYVVLPLAGSRAEFWAGQMKVPSTYEVNASSANLDFVTRSQLSDEIADLSLCTSPALSSPRFNGAKTFQRDLGLALKGRISGCSYFAMVGNGLGANRFVGGAERKQEVYANPPGAHLYALRIVYRLPGASSARGASRWQPDLALGGHVSWNHHPNIVLDDERTVLDLERHSWSLNLRGRVLQRLHATALYGAGVVGDDFDGDGRDDYRYAGWEMKVIAELIAERLFLGLRVDRFTDERYENGYEEHSTAFTFGATVIPRTRTRLQLNYKHKVLDAAQPDPADDALLLMAQVRL